MPPPASVPSLMARPLVETTRDVAHSSAEVDRMMQRDGAVWCTCGVAVQSTCRKAALVRAAVTLCTTHILATQLRASYAFLNPHPRGDSDLNQVPKPNY